MNDIDISDEGANDPLNELLAAEAVSSRLKTKPTTRKTRSKAMQTQSMSDLSTLASETVVTSAASKLRKDIDAHRTVVTTLRESMTKLDAARAGADKELARLTAKAMYLKGPEFDAQVKAANEVCAELAADMAELTEELHSAETKFLHMQQMAAQERVRAVSESLKFVIPVGAANGSDERTVTDYAVLRCNLLGALARALQDTIVTGEDYYQRELARAYGEPAETAQNGTMPEELQARAAIRVEQLREFRETVQALRHTVERQFKEARDDVPDSSNTRPRMLWQTDSEAKARYDERRATRAAAARAAITQALTAEQRLTRALDASYTPDRSLL